MKKTEYQIEITEDGSPTLRWGAGESMHHSGGAASESIYIYQAALDFWLHSQRVPLGHSLTSTLNLSILNENSIYNQAIDFDSVSIMSLGFGLGYNEILVALWALKNQIPLNKVLLTSYEKESFLYEEFNLWLEDKQTGLTGTYDLILKSLIDLNVQNLNNKT